MKNQWLAALCLVILGSVCSVGCGPDTSTTVSAPPPELSQEEKAAQETHYAAPSQADRK